MPEIVTADDAIQRISDGATVLVNPTAVEEVYAAFGRVFEQYQSPKDLTMVFAAGLGPFSDEPKGMNHFAIPGMLKRIIIGHMGLNHKLVYMVATNMIEAYNLPQGTMTQLYREIGAGRPGLLTKVGLGTFADPRIEGGKLNDKTQDCEELNEVMEINGEEYLFYKSFPCDIGIIRATTADPDGNLTYEREALYMEPFETALAVKNSGGFVIAQVERLSDVPADPHRVIVPGILVDMIVVAKPENHPQTMFTHYDPTFTGEERVDLNDVIQPMPLSAEKVIARRAAMEIEPDTVVNLGIGIPMGVAQVAFEEGLLNEIHLNTEVGVIGGLPEGGKNFGPAKNPRAIISQAAMFDFYDGGGLDLSCVGMAQVDKEGNVNVSKLGPKIIGCGGFVNITTAAKKLIFAGEFEAAGLKTGIENGKLVIHEYGKACKFIDTVQQITFSGKVARKNDRDVIYVTERCVFKLVPEGLMLAEVAPGVDIQKDILDRMQFAPIVPDEVPLMDATLFQDAPLKECVPA